MPVELLKFFYPLEEVCHLLSTTEEALRKTHSVDLVLGVEGVTLEQIECILSGEVQL